MTYADAHFEPGRVVRRADPTTHSRPSTHIVAHATTFTDPRMSTDGTPVSWRSAAGDVS